MRKGDARREQILRTAEALFYAQGYEQTSVQDILDAIGISKGGFYHHFESKLDLLDAICQQRAEESARAAQKAAESVRGNPPAELNALVSCSGLLRAESLDYISLLLRVAWREDGALMREKMKNSQMDAMLPVAKQIAEEVLNVLEQTSPELIADISENGIVLTGGGAKLRGLDTLISKQTKMRVRIAEEPEDCVILGAGRAVQWIDSVKMDAGKENGNVPLTAYY